MPKVKLELAYDGRIVAPEFCPFVVRGNRGGVTCNVVDPAICGVCKYCTFTHNLQPDPPSPISIEITEADRKLFHDYLVETNKKAATSLYSQQQFLLFRESRIPIAVFLGAEFFRNMLAEVYQDSDRVNQVFSTVMATEMCICYVLGSLPVYVSRTLVKSDIQVIGEVEWNQR